MEKFIHFAAIFIQKTKKPISAEQVRGIGTITVLHTDGGAFGIIHIDNDMLAAIIGPFLGYCNGR